MALSDYQDRVDDLTRADSEDITQGQRDRAIIDAVLQYSKDRPRRLSAYLPGDDSQYLPLPDLWIDGLSILYSAWLDGTKIAARTEETADGFKIRSVVPVGEGSNLVVQFAGLHTLDETDDSIPAMAREAVSNYAAGILMDQLSANYAGHQMPTIEADAVAWQTKSAEYASRAKSYKAVYFDRLGIKPDRLKAASVTIDLDLPNSLGGDRLTHPGRRR